MDEANQHHVKHGHTGKVVHPMSLKRSVNLLGVSIHLPDADCSCSRSISDIVNSVDVPPPCALASHQSRLPIPSISGLKVVDHYVTVAFFLTSTVEVTMPAQVMEGRILLVRVPRSTAYLRTVVDMMRTIGLGERLRIRNGRVMRAVSQMCDHRGCSCRPNIAP